MVISRQKSIHPYSWTLHCKHLMQQMLMSTFSLWPLESAQQGTELEATSMVGL